MQATTVSFTSKISAATFVATVSDLSRFETPQLLMSYLGHVPSELQR
ncbi:transposase [Caballeronia calidae]